MEVASLRTPLQGSTYHVGIHSRELSIGVREYENAGAAALTR